MIAVDTNILVYGHREESQWYNQARGCIQSLAESNLPWLIPWPLFKQIVTQSKVAGPVVHDAKIAAICQEHDIDVLWTADRDFSRFPGLRVKNPLIG